VEIQNAHVEMISITQHLKPILATLELTTIAKEGGYEIITIMQYVLQLILWSYDLILHLHIYISLECKWCYIQSVSVCITFDT